MNRFLERARTLWLAAVAVGTTLLGGVLLASSVRGLGAVAVLGVLAVTLGVVVFMSTVFLVLRREHDTAQDTARRIVKLSKTTRRQPTSVLDTAQLDTALDHHARQVIAAVDARLIGLYERERRS